jgi:hypothetical protein
VRGPRRGVSMSKRWPQRAGIGILSSIHMDVHFEESTNDYIFAEWNRVLLAIWRGKTTSSALRHGETLFERLEGPLLLLTIVEATASLPTLDARVELVGVLKRAAGKIERSAVVFEGEGFRAASVRAVVAGVSLFSRPTYPHRVFGTVSAAARFLTEGKSTSLSTSGPLSAPASPPPSAALITRMVHEARRRPRAGAFAPWAPGAPVPGASLRQR